MKGLFYKETRCLWQYGKSYILMVAVFFGLSMVNDGGGINTMWLLYPVFLLASLPASLLNADEKDGWMMYCETLPVTRRQIVTVKYVICAILAAAVTLLAIAAAAAVYAILALALGVVTAEDLRRLPKGEKWAQRLHLR